LTKMSICMLSAKSIHRVFTNCFVFCLIFEVLGPGRPPKGFINRFRLNLTESEPVATPGVPIRANFCARKNPPKIIFKFPRQQSGRFF
jgi:hypothetical protein